MDNIASYAVFNADVADDSKEDLNGDVIIPAGRGIMEAVCRQIESANVEVKPPSQHSFYGWEMAFHIEKVEIWLLLQQPGPWLLIVECRASWLTRSKTKVDALLQGLKIVGTALSAESKIKNLQWMTKAQYESSKRRN